MLTDVTVPYFLHSLSAFINVYLYTCAIFDWLQNREKKYLKKVPTDETVATFMLCNILISG